MSNSYTFVAGSDGKPVRLGYPIRQLSQKDVDGANAGERKDLAVADVVYRLAGDDITLYGWDFATKQLVVQPPVDLVDLASPPPIGNTAPNTGVFTSLRFRNIANTFSGLFQSMITSARTWTFPDQDGTVALTSDLTSKQNLSEKGASNGYAGLTLFAINARNVANTFTSLLTNTATAVRTWTFPDKDGTVAMTSDITGTNSGVNTGDQVLPTLGSLGGASLGANTFTGNQTISGNKVINALLEKTTEVRATASIASGVLALDCANGLSAVSLNAAITSITLANNAASATVVQCHTVEFTADGTARAITWPAGNGTSTLLFKWPGGTAPTMTSTNGKRDVIMFKSVSQWLWDAFVVGQNL